MTHDFWFESIAKTNTTHTPKRTIRSKIGLRVLLKQIQHTRSLLFLVRKPGLRVLLKQIQHTQVEPKE